MKITGNFFFINTSIIILQRIHNNIHYTIKNYYAYKNKTFATLKFHRKFYNKYIDNVYNKKNYKYERYKNRFFILFLISFII